ncbi:Protein hir-1 [Taphrina deformans PYCC 5710]|uniref:Protein HIR n=1 Tax=Taphrina deformans (strain PYCC 5710 / ATCC 11124 / CBS 356.35 / IMI 108563 / JCM 9778 / NBRC 8474) TaxID=1097556 RepID=R4XCJ9_TAPDE|nr:Protein hir-1 [Taphrina deformans PYCC 5710]|eukprot:CCG83614.1 Protein hir-1 [Taphrina deformans PYCC 5710]
MLLLRPSWLGHFAENETRQAIYSLDVSSDGVRLVSGGLDGKVRIWDVAKCLAPPEEVEQSGLLATMPAHTGTSGSDDKLLIIWEREEGASVQKRSYGEQEEVKEVWKVHRRLVGHQGDIMDLAWSHDSALLVSTGVDSTVFVWSGTTFEKKKEITAHASSVKGITFDPAGKYFATASDDRTIKVWRTSDLLCEAIISGPFENSPISTYFRRPSWSPDGNNIAAANSMNGLVPAISIINRGTWESDINLIGHEGAVEVVKFNPVIFTRDDVQITIVACAGLDRVLSIWNTVQTRPIATSSDIAEQGISDLAWTPNGLGLFVCSFDGTLTVLRFEEHEFGKALGRDANEEALSKYGAGRHGAVMPESIEQLQLEDASRKETEENRKGRIADLMGDVEVHVNGSKNLAPGGETQIRPQQTLDQEMHEANQKPGNSSNSVTAQERTTSIIDNSVPEPAVMPETTSAETGTIPDTPVAAATPKPYVQKVTMVNGKKRIQPQLISSGPSQPQVLSRPTATTTTPSQTLDISQPSQALPRGGIPSLIIGNKRPAEEEHEDATATKRATNGASAEIPEFMRPAVVAPATTVSQIRLGTPQVKSYVSHNQATGRPYVIEACNAANSHDPAKITFMRGTRIEWVDYLRSAVVLLIGTASFVAAACEDGGVIVWTPSGRRYMSQIVLEAIPVFLEARDDYLMVISSVGILHVWNLKQQRSPFAPVSLAPALDAASSIVDKIRRTSSVTQASITSKGVPIVTLSNGDGFIYHADMQTWLKVSEGWWAISSSYWDASGLVSRNGLPPGIIDLVERRTNDEVMRQGKGRVFSRVVKQALMKEGFENLETIVSIGHLENRLAAAKMLDSKDEYHTVVLMYAQKLAEEGMTLRVEELCRELIGPMTKEIPPSSAWIPSVLGLDKRDLLRECLVQMGRFRGVQRVCTEFAAILKRVTDSADEIPL